MARWLPGKRVSLTSAASVEEVQRRLAAATAEWTARGWGSPVPRPPWPSGEFTAVAGSPYLSILPVVVRGTVRPEASGSRLEATIRPHGFALFGTGAFVIFAGLNAANSGSVGRIILPVVALFACLILFGLSREGARPLEALLKDACR